MKRDAGLLTEEELQELIVEATSDERMTEQVAQELQSDQEWLSDAGLTENQVWEYVPPEATDDSPKSRVHPTVWAAAAERWEAMDEALKLEMRRTAEEDVRLTTGDGEQAVFFVVAVFATLYSMLMPIRYIGCTISSALLAFRIASNLGG